MNKYNIQKMIILKDDTFDVIFLVFLSFLLGRTFMVATPLKSENISKSTYIKNYLFRGIVW